METQELKIRDMIEGYRNEVKKKDLQPPRAAKILTELSALMGNCLDAIRKQDHAYNIVLQKFRSTERSAVDAKIKAECSNEYLSKREAHDTYEVVKEMVRAIKYFLREAEESYRQSGN